MNKLAKRKAMKKLAILLAQSAAIRVFIEHLRAAVSYVGGLPTEWFRPDQPKIDHARPGGDRTALAYLRGREVVEIIHDEVTTK